MRDNEGFWHALRDVDKRSAILWVSSVVLITLHLYEGNEKFWVKHFAQGIEPGPLLDWYKYLYKHLASLLLFFVIPACIVKLVLRENLRDFGWQAGDWKQGLKVALIACAVMTPIFWISSRNAEFRNFYPLTTLANASPFHFFLWGLTYLPHYIGWEFFFRGYLNFGLQKKHGAFAAMMVTTAYTTILHIGKPEGETWSTIVAGVLLSLLSFRTGSVWYAVLFHFYAGMANTYFAGI